MTDYERYQDEVNAPPPEGMTKLVVGVVIDTEQLVAGDNDPMEGEAVAYILGRDLYMHAVKMCAARFKLTPSRVDRLKAHMPDIYGAGESSPMPGES